MLTGPKGQKADVIGKRDEFIEALLSQARREGRIMAMLTMDDVRHGEFRDRAAGEVAAVERLGSRAADLVQDGNMLEAEAIAWEEAALTGFSEAMAEYAAQDSTRH